MSGVVEGLKRQLETALPALGRESSRVRVADRDAAEAVAAAEARAAEAEACVEKETTRGRGLQERAETAEACALGLERDLETANGELRRVEGELWWGGELLRREAKKVERRQEKLDELRN
eukprot:6767367-Prymnesium_polylepis.1